MNTRGGGSRIKYSVVYFPRHLQDTRKALRHRQAGTMLYNRPSRKRVFDIEGGAPCTVRSPVNHARCTSLMGGKEALTQPVSCLNTKHSTTPSSPQNHKKDQNALGTRSRLPDRRSGTGSDKGEETLVLRSLRYKCRDRKRLAVSCQPVSSPLWALPYVPDLILFVVVLILIVLCHRPGMHPQLPQFVLWSQLPCVLQVVQEDHGAPAAKVS